MVPDYWNINSYWNVYSIPLLFLGGYKMTVKFFNGKELVYTIEAIELSYAICYINFSGIEWTSYEIV